MHERTETGVYILGNDLLPDGTWVMLSEEAPAELVFAIGSEAVLRVFCRSSPDMEKNADGDLIIRNRYHLRHMHRGRLYMDVPEAAIRVIDDEAAQGQNLLHGEMTRDLARIAREILGS